MESGDDYYATLRVAADADDAVIRASYRALMRRYHPDVNQSGEAVAKATAINEAYACLRDQSERAAYDRRRTYRASAVRPSATQSASSRAPGAHRPRPAPGGWTAQHAYVAQSKPKFHPTWWKAAGLGLATLFTIVTFTITSATPPRGPVIVDRGAPAIQAALAEQRFVGGEVTECRLRGRLLECPRVDK